jgi:hypothetical protein
MDEQQALQLRSVQVTVQSQLRHADDPIGVLKKEDPISPIRKTTKKLA